MKKNYKQILDAVDCVAKELRTEYRGYSKSRKKVSLNSIFVNALVNHALDLIDPDWTSDDIPALNRVKYAPGRLTTARF